MRSHTLSINHDTSERHSQQSYTIGDAIGIAVQKRETESTSMSSTLTVMWTSKDKRSTKNTFDERGQKKEERSVSRLVEYGHTVVFRHPGQGVTCKTTPTATGRSCGSAAGSTTLICGLKKKPGANEQQQVSGSHRRCMPAMKRTNTCRSFRWVTCT